MCVCVKECIQGFVKERTLHRTSVFAANFALSNNETRPNHATYVMWVVMILHAITHTHHTLLAKAEELLDLLRH